uniref:Uncharacterized protein n=1 Tax=Vespula pensylvanica TaxID=30213 RepID=A0A834JQV2_VESPE|nr:hypothetical protein H0235_017439 [Vespula pensylvanica]
MEVRGTFNASRNLYDDINGDLFFKRVIISSDDSPTILKELRRSAHLSRSNSGVYDDTIILDNYNFNNRDILVDNEKSDSPNRSSPDFPFSSVLTEASLSEIIHNAVISKYHANNNTQDLTSRSRVVVNAH